MALVWALGATFVVSLLSLVGVVTLGVKKDYLDRIVLLMIGFAAGSLIGAAFLHLLPEALEHCGCRNIFLYAVIGFSFFFILERYLYWRHCHHGVCDVHVFTYLNLVGDAVHNFIDGTVIAVAFTTDVRLGLVTTLAIMFHELPQELGDFSILVYGGFSKSKALLFNFLCGLTSMLGAVAGYLLMDRIGNLSMFLLPFTAGGFTYIAASDLLPELHKQKDTKRANLSFLAFFVGLGFMWLMSGITETMHVH